MASQQPQESTNASLFSNFEDQTREEIINELISQGPGLFNRMPQYAAGLYWLADINCLEAMTVSPQKRRQAFELTKILGGLDLAGILGGKAQFPSENTEAKPPLDKSRKTSVTTEVEKRDGNKCVLTKLPQPTLEFARIVQHKIHGKPAPREMWYLLRIFWGGQAEQWEKDLVDHKTGLVNTEQICNMLTLEPQAAAYWDEGVTGFRPISMNDDGTSLTLEYVTLFSNDKSGLGKRTDIIRLEDFPRRFSKEYIDELLRRDDEIPTLDRSNFPDIRFIKSGYIFTITTDDPVKRPLPSMNLLGARWIFTRIAAMQGRGEDE
ncbi:hypothetical protein N7456_008219 [Penicillium angulare]|uniref:HNH nuclease domain-containing protein n=1 Tax=Penicillium angulare TaxID=116970 RepID=A0A9W9K903_9EURO|nr:hypothetical protein N7456_008219 [Penicillium angulare]